MTGILINKTFTNPNLPIGETWASRVLALPSCRHWFQADAASCSLVGSDVDTFVDRKGTGAVLQAVASGRRPAMVNNQINGYSVADFDPTANDACSWVGSGGAAQPSLASAFSFVIVARLDAIDVARCLFGSFTSSTVRAILAFNPPTSTTELLWQVGGIGSIKLPFTIGQNFAAIVSFDGSSTTKASINGVQVAPLTAGTGAPGSTAIVLGGLNTSTSGNQPWDGAVADIMDFSGDIFANATALATVKSYISSAYGLAA